MQPNVIQHQQLQQMVKPFLHFQMLELVNGQCLPEFHLFEFLLLVLVAVAVAVVMLTLQKVVALVAVAVVRVN
jgi:hypothetical protein